MGMRETCMGGDARDVCRGDFTLAGGRSVEPWPGRGWLGEERTTEAKGLFELM